MQDLGLVIQTVIGIMNYNFNMFGFTVNLFQLFLFPWFLGLVVYTIYKVYE